MGHEHVLQYQSWLNWFADQQAAFQNQIEHQKELRKEHHILL